MKKLLAIILALVCLVGVVGCSDEHTNTADTPSVCNHSYSEATCLEAAKCYYCGETSGAVSDHNFASATCTSPEKCTVCNETRGVANGHSFLQATCVEAQKCRNCGATQGTALGHDWKKATCTEPKTCKRCNATEGLSNGHTYSTATMVCKNCKYTLQSKDFTYLAGSDFREIKSNYPNATPNYAYVALYKDANGENCVLTYISYKIISDYEHVTLHKLASNQEIDDPVRYYEKMEDRYFGAVKLKYIDLQIEIINLKIKMLNGESGVYVDPDYLSIGLN